MKDLIERLEAGERSNALDALVEVALFQPDDRMSAAVLNSAGTKVVYTKRDGSSLSCWAWDWSHSPANTIALLRALETK